MPSILRTWIKRLSLARKLTAMGILTSATSLVIAAAVLVAYDRSNSTADILVDTELLADLVANATTAALTFGDAKAATEILGEVTVNPRIMSAAILLADGETFAQYVRPGAAPSPVPPEAAVRGRQPWHAFDGQTLLVIKPIRLEHDVIGTVVLTTDLDKLRARSLALVRVLGLALFAAACVAWAVASRLQRMISGPLVRLAGVTRAVTRERRYDLRAEADRGGDEIGELIGGFNEMLGEIQARDLQLLQNQDQLEQTVEARTAELRATNTDLVAARDKAMEASRAKSEFLANMSHEIRTPMNGVLGMTELALDSELTADQRDCLTTVRSSAQSLLAILNDILDFSKIESRKLELEAIPFSIATLVKDLLKTQSLNADQKGLELLCDLDPAIPAAIVGDPVRVRQVLANLIGNAIKFTTRGHVLLQVREDARANGCTRLHFLVSDTGLGIPPEKHATIFEAFSQADGSTTRRFGGTGLGLTISATLVKLMAGQMWVESAEGAGSTFHFTASFETPAVPEVTPRALSDAPETAPVATAAAASIRRRAKVLVAEDNIVNQRVAFGLLTRRGHTVIVANNGREALAALEREVFDLVLMDVQMPEMGGLAASAAIRQREAETGGHVRIVAMTAHAMTGDRELCIAAGMDGYLSKPIDPSLLFAVVEQGATGMAATTPARSAGPVDYELLLERLGGDVELVADVARLFLEFCPGGVSAIKAAIDRRDAIGLTTTAHALKGAAANLSARALCDAAQTLERLGAELRLAPAQAAWRRLSVEAAAVMDTLRQFDGVKHAVAG